MSDSHLYYPLWRKYLSVMRVLMKNARNGNQELNLSKADFLPYGNRNASEYFFNLEIVDGSVMDTTISGSAVARDLRDILIADPTSKQLLKNTYYKINIGKNYILHIQILKNDQL